MVKRIMRLEPPYFISIGVTIALWSRFQFSAGGPPLDIAPATAALHLGYLIDIALKSSKRISYARRRMPNTAVAIDLSSLAADLRPHASEQNFGGGNSDGCLCVPMA
jgi:hypothetical protein